MRAALPRPTAEPSSRLQCLAGIVPKQIIRASGTAWTSPWRQSFQRADA
jgi:hypothetical protein